MLSVSRRILVSAPRDSVRSYLSDLREIARYEPKVSAIEVAPPAEGLADREASVQGRFFGLPWHGTFRFETTQDGGYRGVMVRGPIRRMECRVILRSVIGGTLVEHDETYELPILMRPLNSLIRRWLDKTLESELGSIKEGAEGLNRRLQLQRLDA
ncbi:MAG TPA: SRPBCC family protein [Elusimicrobiota bacterium]|jgi:hypothetical protein|nr:SRPBCC family protein [Elusimicrobiota bacterium]